MITPGIKSVAIIGAGVAGLATARMLSAEGISCTVFDRNPDLGGVWSLGYIDFGVQVQKELYEFPDYPLPGGATNFTPGPEFQRYLESYCDHFGIRGCLRLGTRIDDIARRGDGAPGWALTFADADGTRVESFDMVVAATGLYSEKPNIPDFPGREDFAGTVMHAYEIDTRAPLDGRDVVVIGYGKSATDIAGEAAKVARSTHMVFRNTHWPVPRKLAGVLPFKWGMLNRTTAALIPPYVHAGPITRRLHEIGKPLVWVYWRLVELLLRVQMKLDTPIARGKTLLPDVPVEIGCFSETTMVPRPGFIDLIRSGQVMAHRTEIDHYTNNGVVLKDGDEIAADCVVFGTGWQRDYGYLGEEVQNVLGDDRDGFYLYRHILHPGLENFAFIGRAATYASVLTYSLQARWLAEVVSGRTSLPEPAAMSDEIAQIRDWKRAWMPEGGRAALLGLHMGHYHDELLRDIGADPFRKNGIFAPFKELMAPYQSSDYRTVVAGQWRDGRELP